MVFIKLFAKVRDRLVGIKARFANIKTFFREKSGGKTVVKIKKIAPVAIVMTIVVAALMDYLTPKEDHTFFRHGSAKSEFKQDKKLAPLSDEVKKLLSAGKRQVEADQKKEAEQKRKRISINYSAPQIVGDGDVSSRNMIRSGSKLIGILKNPIDTRAQSLVRVVLPRGGEFGNVEIQPGSVLVGHFNYNGDNDIVYIKFSRLDLPDGSSPRKISAAALDAGSFSPGIQGEEFTGGGTKLAASIGLTMFAGMTDTLTDKEAVGNSYNSVQAKPTMKNALLQGLSKASQDQASRAASAIEQERNYVIVPEGKEMIIELLEDFK